MNSLKEIRTVEDRFLHIDRKRRYPGDDAVYDATVPKRSNIESNDIVSSSTFSPKPGYYKSEKHNNTEKYNSPQANYSNNIPTTNRDGYHESIMATLSTMNKLLEKEAGKHDSNDDEVSLFLQSLAPSLRRLSPRNFGLAKLHICEYLFSLEHPTAANK